MGLAGLLYVVDGTAPQKQFYVLPNSLQQMLDAKLKPHHCAPCSAATVQESEVRRFLSGL